MTYTKPNLFELGTAQHLVLGPGGAYAEFETDQVGTPDDALHICPNGPDPLPVGESCNL